MNPQSFTPRTNDVHLTVGESCLIDFRLPFVFSAWLAARVKLLRSNTWSDRHFSGSSGALLHRGQVPAARLRSLCRGTPFLARLRRPNLCLGWKIHENVCKSATNRE